MRNLVICQEAQRFPDTETVTFSTLRKEVKDGRIFRRLGQYGHVELRVPSIATFDKPAAKLLVARALSMGSCTLASSGGEGPNIGWGDVFRAIAGYFRDLPGRTSMPRHLAAEVETWPKRPRDQVRIADGEPLVVRTDLEFALENGGLISHLRGVLEGLSAAGYRPSLLTMAESLQFSGTAEIVQAAPVDRFWNFAEIPLMATNRRLVEAGRRVRESRPVSFVYQHNIAYATSGYTLARERNVPLVLEYNGPEVWMNRHWGHPLRYEPLAEQVERANLIAADLVVVVSQVLKDELIDRGVEADRVVVAPCAANLDRFRPDIDGSPVRDRLGMNDALVVGFVGSFAAWHGAETLARAFANTFADGLAGGKPIRLLLIGDGPTMPTVRNILGNLSERGIAHCVGATPPDKVPAHLAACDILISPQVENADGSPYFGSPLKLFEYMAMGKAVVASNLGQIGQIIRHGESGLLASPGVPEDLAARIAELAESESFRNRLGANARRDAVAKHSWPHHVATILDALREHCG